MATAKSKAAKATRGWHRPPAFQLYASDTLASRAFSLMSAGERGVYLSMVMACWVNDKVPVDVPSLARVIGLPEADRLIHKSYRLF